MLTHRRKSPHGDRETRLPCLLRSQSHLRVQCGRLIPPWGDFPAHPPETSGVEIPLLPRNPPQRTEHSWQHRGPLEKYPQPVSLKLWGGACSSLKVQNSPKLGLVRRSQKPVASFRKQTVEGAALRTTTSPLSAEAGGSLWLGPGPAQQQGGGLSRQHQVAEASAGLGRRLAPESQVPNRTTASWEMQAGWAPVYARGHLGCQLTGSLQFRSLSLGEGKGAAGQG